MGRSHAVCVCPRQGEGRAHPCTHSSLFAATTYVRAALYRLSGSGTPPSHIRTPSASAAAGCGAGGWFSRSRNRGSGPHAAVRSGVVQRPPAFADNRIRTRKPAVVRAEGLPDCASGGPGSLLQRVPDTIRRTTSLPEKTRMAPCRASVPLPFPTTHAGSCLVGRPAMPSAGGKPDRAPPDEPER